MNETGYRNTHWAAYSILNIIKPELWLEDFMIYLLFLVLISKHVFVTLVLKYLSTFEHD